MKVLQNLEPKAVLNILKRFQIFQEVQEMKKK